MTLIYAIDELYKTGWSDLDSTGCAHASDGRAFPRVERVRREFADAGFELSIRHIVLFDCYRAEWRDASGRAAGAVVGQTEEEAGVYALAHLRRQVAPSAA